MAQQPPSSTRKRQSTAKRKASGKAAAKAPRKAASGAQKKAAPSPPPKRAAPPPSPTARKRRDYKAEYARRMAGKAKGTPEYKKGRGHKPGVSERQRRIASRERAMWDYALAQERRSKTDADDLMEMLREGVAEHGPVWFRKLERARNELHRDYVAAGWPKGGQIVGMAGLEDMAATFETDVMLLFYH